MVFQSFWVLGPILAHQTDKFELSGQFCFSRHPWGPWGSQSSGVKAKSANPITVASAPKTKLHCIFRKKPYQNWLCIIQPDFLKISEQKPGFIQM